MVPLIVAGFQVISEDQAIQIVGSRKNLQLLLRAQNIKITALKGGYYALGKIITEASLVKSDQNYALVGKPKNIKASFDLLSKGKTYLMEWQATERRIVRSQLLRNAALRLKQRQRKPMR